MTDNRTTSKTDLFSCRVLFGQVDADWGEEDVADDDDGGEPP